MDGIRLKIALYPQKRRHRANRPAPAFQLFSNPAGIAVRPDQDPGFKNRRMGGYLKLSPIRRPKPLKSLAGPEPSPFVLSHPGKRHVKISPPDKTHKRFIRPHPIGPSGPRQMNR